MDIYIYTLLVPTGAVFLEGSLTANSSVCTLCVGDLASRTPQERLQVEADALPERFPLEASLARQERNLSGPLPTMAPGTGSKDLAMRIVLTSFFKVPKFRNNQNAQH